jgi:hypothetical protein
MKKASISLFLAATISLSALTVSGQKADFSGSWKLDRSRSIIPEYTAVLVKITIGFAGDSLLTERVYDIGDGQEYPFKENLTLDGREYKITIYEMPRTAKAVMSEQENAVMLESTIIVEGSGGTENFVSAETWKVDKASGTLTISFKNKMSGGESEGSFIFTPADAIK